MPIHVMVSRFLSWNCFASLTQKQQNKERKYEIQKAETNWLLSFFYIGAKHDILIIIIFFGWSIRTIHLDCSRMLLCLHHSDFRNKLRSHEKRNNDDNYYSVVLVFKDFFPSFIPTQIAIVCLCVSSAEPK